MERNVMGELNVYRGSGAKPNFSEIARRHGMDRHTVAKYWREGEAAADGRSARGSAFDPLEEVIRAKAQLPGMTKMAVCITDNMSCLVTVSGRRRTRQERAWRFAREAGFELRLCAPRSPQTKGKDESANRFLNRLLAYGGEFTGWSGLAEAVARIEAQANSEPNRTTGLPPDALFMREKESLRPIGNLRLLESMVGDVSVQTVPPTMLVRAAGREWSVPRRCIGRRVSVIAMPGGQVVVRMAGEEVAVHDAASGPSRPINYDPDHYGQALEGKRGLADADIAEAARANLALLDSLGGA